MTVTRFQAEDSVSGFRGPSTVIFDDLQKIRADADRGLCMYVDDDFAVPTNHASVSASGGYYTYQDTGGTITGKGINDLGKELGVLVFSGDGTQNDEQHLQFGHGNQWRIDNSAGNTGALMAEWRVSVNSVTDNVVAFACGFIEGPVAADHLDDGTGEIKNGLSFIGFRSLNDDGNQLDIVYQDTSASTVVTVLANAVTLTAGTYVRLGMKYNPNESAAHKITFYKDGTALAYVNTTQIDTSTFPEAEGMVPAVLNKTLSAVSKLNLDRFTAVQYMNNIY